MKVTRRDFLKILLIIKSSIVNSSLFSLKSYANMNTQGSNHISSEAMTNNFNIGVSEDGKSTVYKILGGSPEDNMHALVDRLGGIEKLIGRNDIVVLKPNAQWWMQGMTNTDSMKTFMELILNSKKFQGEIIIAENNQYNDFNGRGWSSDKPNGKFNYNQLIDYFNGKGFKNVTSYHWRGAGPNPEPLEGDDDGSGGKRVSGPADGDGYVWCDDNIYVSPEGKHCWMTYPVFTSKYSGITVDLKNGAWKNGNYMKDRIVKFINFSALNHHSFYCGITASVKNLMGVVDMSCGFQAPTPQNTYNVHFIGVKKYIKLRNYISKRKIFGKLRHSIYASAYKNFHYTGGALGKFIRDIRKPDLNIITAHWVGWGSRWDKKKSSYPKALLASRDPVALDYVGAKDVLLPETPTTEADILRLNNPEIKDGRLYKFLMECHLQGIGNLNEEKIRRIEIKIQNKE